MTAPRTNEPIPLNIPPPPPPPPPPANRAGPPAPAPAPAKPPTLEGLYKPGAASGSAGKLGITIYGRGGSGKTTLLSTMPGKGLVIDVPQVEGGTDVLAGNDHIDVYPVGGWNDIVRAHQYLSTADHGYDWVAIDSITAMQELAKRKTIKERPLDADIYSISQQDYGKIGRLVGELVYQFRRLPVQSIWIAQERVSREDGQYGPDLIPSALSMLSPSMGIVVRLSVEHGLDGQWIRKMRVGPHPTYMTKYRARPGLDVPPVMRPHLGELIAYLEGTGPRPDEIPDGIMTAIVTVPTMSGGGL